MSSPRALVAHLLRRAGFGAAGPELDAAAAAGFPATVDRLLAGLSEPDNRRPPLPALSTFPELQHGHGDSYDQYEALISWWVEKMATTTTPLREKLTLLLHNQFPTGFDKVGVPIFMYHQNELFRTLGPGRFDTLTLALSKDPAMLLWLDTGSDQRQAPNENFARELMERFTMGIGNYTETDVAESARAFTGWSMDWRSGRFEFSDWNHDYGEKVFLGNRGNLSGEDVVRIVTHTPAAARFVTARIWGWLAYPVGVNDPVVASLAPGFAADLNMTNLLRNILNHPAFVSDQARLGLVKQPIEWVAGILRAFKATPATFHKAGGKSFLHWSFANLGQVPFNPPSVGGWGSGQFWLSTAASLAQFNFAQSVASAVDLSPVEKESWPNRIDAIGELLGIDGWTTQSRVAMNRVIDEPAQLVALALTSPEYVAN